MLLAVRLHHLLENQLILTNRILHLVRRQQCEFSFVKSCLKLKVKVAQSCPTLWGPMYYTVHGVLQARILEWVAFPFSRGSSQPRDWTQVSCIMGRFFLRENPGLPHCRQTLYQLSHKGSPRILEWVASPFSSRSSRPRNQTRVSCIAGRFFTKWAIRESWYFKLTLDYSQFNYSVLFTQDFALHPLLLAFWSTNFSSVDPQGQEREGERRWEKKELIWSVEQVDKKLWALSFLTL